MSRVYLIRRSHTEFDNADPSESKFHGTSDVPLDQHGHELAAQLAGRLQGHGIARIYTSPLSRAGDVAHIVGRTLGVPVIPHPGLVPQHIGEFTGKTGSEAGDALKKTRENPDEPPPGGESLNGWRKKSRSAMSDIFRDAQESGENVAAVTHSDNLLDYQNPDEPPMNGPPKHGSYIVRESHEGPKMPKEAVNVSDFPKAARKSLLKVG